MHLPFLAAALCALGLAPAVRAQAPFPLPGTGDYTWQAVGDRNFKIESLALDSDGNAYFGTTIDSLYVLAPSPSGVPAGRWRGLPPPRGGMSAILPLDDAGDTLIVATFNGGRLSRTTNQGATWTVVNGPFSNPFRLGGPRYNGAYLVLPPGHAHAGRIVAGGSRIYSDDRGATWTDATATRGTAVEDYDIHTLTLLPSGRILAGGFWGVATSDDGGTTYQTTPFYGPYRYEADGLATLATPGSVQSGVPSCGLSDASLCEGAVVVSVDASGTDGVVASRTNDGGRSWAANVVLAQPDDGIGYGIVAGVVDVGPGPDGLGRAVAVLGRGMVYRTGDGGQTWQVAGRLPLDVSEGIHWAAYVVLGPDGHLWVRTIKAGAGPASVYRSAEPASSAFVVATEATPETGEARIRIEPNPSRGRAVVRLVLESPTEARVQVYDALGRSVAVLHDGPLAAGERSFVLDTSSWAPGVYMVRASGGGSRAEARITVTR